MNWKKQVLEWHPTGSNYICDPPVEDTDIDYVCLVKDRHNWDYKKAGMNKTPINDLEYDVQGEFLTYRSGKINLIVTDNTRLYDKWVIATETAKKLNLRNKFDRVNLFKTILETVDEPVKNYFEDIPF